MNIGELKHKVRKLKHYEKALRTRNGVNDNIPLVWDKFFDLNDSDKSTSLYSLTVLAVMGKDEYKTIIDDFFARIYYEVYIHNDIIDAPLYNPLQLEKLELSALASETDVKKRFRELAKKYHPDTGGSSEKFIELMNIYKELIS